MTPEDKENHKTNCKVGIDLYSWNSLGTSVAQKGSTQGRLLLHCSYQHVCIQSSEESSMDPYRLWHIDNSTKIWRLQRIWRCRSPGIPGLQIHFSLKRTHSPLLSWWASTSLLRTSIAMDETSWETRCTQRAWYSLPRCLVDSRSIPVHLTFLHLAESQNDDDRRKSILQRSACDCWPHPAGGPCHGFDLRRHQTGQAFCFTKWRPTETDIWTTMYKYYDELEMDTTKVGQNRGQKRKRE